MQGTTTKTQIHQHKRQEQQHTRQENRKNGHQIQNQPRTKTPILQETKAQPDTIQDAPTMCPQMENKLGYNPNNNR